MSIFKNILKIIFYLLNLIVIIIYLYPGSIVGYIFYGDLNKQYQITKDFVISSNHFYVFFFLSIFGILSYFNHKKLSFIIKYIFLSSIILEILHLLIPNRSFQYSDLFGNITGVLFSVLLLNIYNFWRKK